MPCTDCVDMLCTYQFLFRANVYIIACKVHNWELTPMALDPEKDIEGMTLFFLILLK